MNHIDQEGQERLASGRTRSLLLGCVFMAAALNSSIPGAINRTLIDMPAWQHVGATAWVTFSRWADLGPGLILYPLEYISGTVFSVIAAVVFYINRRIMARSLAVPIYATALCSLGVMLATTQAAPAMLSTLHLSDPTSLQQALNTFWFWGGVRGGCFLLSSVASLWSLVVVSRMH